MRILVICGCLLACTCLVACSDEHEEASYVSFPGSSTAGSPEQPGEVDDSLEHTGRPFTIPEPDTEPGNPTFSGEWTNRDGVWDCDGYMTRFENDVHCAATVPDDWIPFEFEGETFYVAPLSVETAD